ncbi:hypothetical protein [Aneurinibacillus danicus]|jgi:hypothetical protein|uniref:Transposase n=1 Tax=Aneurinibacillus danicus TaxID=267746 RepID=A0A511VC88_9BACL|nr:hypothetical protein [Aneurinibacillus danicus]GEN36474.1 hypothetical protein ADA01nite_39340 [Aneurinibacillus danicus]
MRHNLERTLDEMIEKVEARGKDEGKLEMIRKLFSLGIADIETLSKASDLPKEEMEKLLY